MGAVIAHTFGTMDEEAIKTREESNFRNRTLTGMAEEQADWEGHCADSDDW
jgi:hypothetical protein